MTDTTAINQMLQSTMPCINANNIRSMTTEMDQISLNVIPKEAITAAVKGATAVPDDDLTANVLQSLMTKEEVGKAVKPEAEPEVKDVVLDIDDDIEETKHHQKDKPDDQTRARDVKRQNKAKKGSERAIIGDNSQQKFRGFWSTEENKLFFEANELYGKDFKKISNHIGSRTHRQV